MECPYCKNLMQNGRIKCEKQRLLFGGIKWISNLTKDFKVTLLKGQDYFFNRYINNVYYCIHCKVIIKKLDEQKKK